LTRQARAQLLAVRFPHAAEMLRFYASVDAFQGDETALRQLLAPIVPPGLLLRRVLARRGPCQTHQPVAGVIRDPSRFALVCDVCLTEVEFPGQACPACNNPEIATFAAGGIEYLQVRVCLSCKTYVNVVHAGMEPEAIPDIDEIAAIALDVWAIGQGYTKLRANLCGI
jgi:hypothetical protein